jgi:hypothetical protein
VSFSKNQDGMGGMRGFAWHLSQTPPVRKDSHKFVSHRLRKTESPVEDVVWTPGEPGACRRRRQSALERSGAYS